MYKPLGGNRKSKKRLYLNLMIIFIVSGIWHGVGLTFIVWGMIHGVFIVLYRIIRTLKENWKYNHQELVQKVKNEKYYNKLRYIYKFLGFFITFQLVCYA